ncbi:UDP-N-acetylmuramoyl-L-alanyl-D-glutamate--2,6-diaminopimelate ligase [Alteromonas sp. ASW11-130]|uniref:UDP-N-acetylmuramoyl-L-alanyl-D-glutamate--2, 6-diaminopimelate ligase n=1 Tax=Alteromonas sp. ASW11-130 TaxID=3015775 RepID=UPI0022424696|nr:UDP-N-acetylmuramoyl-L-alanyl-D-glutamate--2,6-diaminopimelate ligase [Alteromonas sp. ASW11-130]MCW8091632.1 UDP-N-acetylmuramoyl-L-alanyl-D-glutamate--2,6-diaminopimelate ligase [Alteromonas sp. ASW11-130]
MVVNAFVQSTRALMAKFGVDAPDIRISGLTLDSREVTTRLAFVAIKGHALDGRDFIPQAISLGAKVILAQTEDKKQHGHLEMRGNSVIISLYKLSDMVSSLAAAFYDYPAQKMATIAVTGTNGKTSVVQLVTQLKSLLGTRCGAIGTLGHGLYEGPETHYIPEPDGTTTPDPIRIQYILADFVQLDVGQAAFEASSHAIVQGRIDQVKTDIAVFTNLSRDHLDYHTSMEDYAQAKRQLLKQAGLHSIVLNAQDPESQNWKKNADKQLKIFWTGIGEVDPQFTSQSHCFATNIHYHAEGSSFTLQTHCGSAEVSIPLFGTFNVYNTLSAVAALLAQGERFAEIVNVIDRVHPVPGRMEIFSFKQTGNVVVDYAHTPDALEKVLDSAKQHTQGEIWCVFGCGGDRDKGKRPLMGQVAEQHASHIVITTDNSRSEKPAAIADDIRQGLNNPEKAILEADREKAIRLCLDKSKPGDLIVVAGKGHEDYQIIGDNRTDYNERAVIARLQQEYSK